MSGGRTHPHEGAVFQQRACRFMLTIRKSRSFHCSLCIVCYCTDFTIKFWHACMNLDLFSLVLLRSDTFE